MAAGAAGGRDAARTKVSSFFKKTNQHLPWLRANAAVCKTNPSTAQEVYVFYLFVFNSLDYSVPNPSQAPPPAPLKVFPQTSPPEDERSVCSQCLPNVQVKNIYTFLYLVLFFLSAKNSIASFGFC